jgi:hypothetical protein
MALAGWGYVARRQPGRTTGSVSGPQDGAKSQEECIRPRGPVRYPRGEIALTRPLRKGRGGSPRVYEPRAASDLARKNPHRVKRAVNKAGGNRVPVRQVEERAGPGAARKQVTRDFLGACLLELGLRKTRTALAAEEMPACNVSPNRTVPDRHR